MSRLLKTGGLIILLLCITAGAFSEQRSIADTPFIQEYRSFYSHENNAKANDVRAVAVDEHDRVWAATADGIYRIEDGDGIYRIEEGGVWQSVQEEEERGPSFAATTAEDGRVWFGTWKGLYHTLPDDSLKQIPDIAEPVGAVGCSGARVVAMGPHGMWLLEEGGWRKHTGSWANSVSAIAFEEGNIFWAATGHGLFQMRDTQILQHLYDENELLTGVQETIAFASDGALWCGGLGGVDVYRAGVRWASYTGREGLPNCEVRHIAFHPDGTAWICTALGVARFKDGVWSLRHSLRWLPSDDARHVAFDSSGTAWIATAQGVSAIHRRMMTLAEKADHYYDILMTRKVRWPWIVGISRLLKQGDVTTSVHEDEDNDGEYTNHYLAMEAFRHQVTGDPVALDRARKAAETMELFQTVTNTPGFIARTIVPPAWASPDTDNPNRLHDRNRTYTERETADILVRDPRMKPVEERWRLSANKQWLWKGDTSSDEICGHFFGYYIFHEYVAQTDEERQRVANLAGRVMDYIIEGNYCLRDIDGQPTRWGVWSPEQLLENGDWRAERSINATELLSYLKTTAYLTGDSKYDAEYKRLIGEYNFLDYARAPKAVNPSERTDIDSSLLALVFPALLAAEKDAHLHEAYLQGLHQWHEQIKDAHNPFFNFICGAYGVENFNLEASVQFLRDAPLDLIYWTVDNREREDLQLVRYPELDHWQVNRLLPPDERFTMRWDKNPYDAVGGSDGYRESTGVYWLLPYWMGRYFGFIEGPES